MANFNKRAQPPEVCTKCGDTVFNGPRFEDESLKWECSTCRHIVYRPCLDNVKVKNEATLSPF